MATIIGRCGGGCTGIIDSTAEVGADCGVHSVGQPSGRVLTSDGANGSSWGTVLSPLEEHLYVASMTVPAITAMFLPMAHWGGSVILNVAFPTRGIITTKGLYAGGATVTVDGPGPATLGSGIEFSFQAVNLAGPGWPVGVAGPGFASYDIPGTNFTTWHGEAHIPVAIMLVNDWFQVAVDNTNSFNVDVTVGIRVVKIANL